MIKQCVVCGADFLERHGCLRGKARSSLPVRGKNAITCSVAHGLENDRNKRVANDLKQGGKLRAKNKAYQAARYALDPQGYRDKANAYYAANRESIIAASRRYAAKHPEQTKRYARECARRKAMRLESLTAEMKQIQDLLGGLTPEQIAQVISKLKTMESSNEVHG